MKAREDAAVALGSIVSSSRTPRPRVGYWRQPWIARLLRSRAYCLAIPLVFGVFGLLVVLGFDGWRCPSQAALGLPCPGCGMTRSLLAGLSGQWHEMLSLNPLGPVLGLVLGGLAVAGLLPSRWRLALADRSETLETRFAPLLILMALLAGLWLARAGGLLITSLWP